MGEDPARRRNTCPQYLSRVDGRKNPTKINITIIKPKWRLYQATEVIPSCVTRGTCIPNMLPGRLIGGGSVLNGQVQDAEEALALQFRMKIQFLGSHTITLPVILRQIVRIPLGYTAL